MAATSGQPNDQAKLAQKALDLKQANEKPAPHPAAADHAGEGMLPKPDPEQPTSGALDAEGHRPVLERSRKVR